MFYMKYLHGLGANGSLLDAENSVVELCHRFIADSHYYLVTQKLLTVLVETMARAGGSQYDKQGVYFLKSSGNSILLEILREFSNTLVCILKLGRMFL